MVSTKFFSTLTVTKLQSCKCGVSENIMVYYTCPIGTFTESADVGNTAHYRVPKYLKNCME